MVNTVKKGYRLEKKARDELVRDGYTIWFKSTRTRFGCQDFANLFDIVAVFSDGESKHRRYISVKSFVSVSRHKEHIQHVQNFAKVYGVYGKPSERFEVWLYKGNGKWQVESFWGELNVYSAR